MNRTRFRWLAIAVLVLAAYLWPFGAQAGLPAPDNLIYGTIVLDGRPVTATNPTVVVQVRRILAGPAIASYQMGTSAEAGNLFYVLRLGLESPPVQQASNSQVGDSFFIVVTDPSGIREIRSFRIAEWGGVARIDFGPSLDADNSGISDSWEQLSGPGDSQSDLDNDKLSKLSEYIAGTNPNEAQSSFKIEVAPDPATEQIIVSFFARAAEGIGYEGRTRFYMLESTTNLLLAPWRPVTSFEAVLGQNQTILFAQPRTNPPAFYRARVWLQGP